LQLKGDSTNGSLGDTFHKVGSESSDFVTHALWGCDCYLIDYALVGVEIKSETSVVLLDDGACTLFDGLSTDSLFIVREERDQLATWMRRWIQNFGFRPCARRTTE
jgi:hypothetical protein